MTEVYSLESREIILLGCKSTWAKEVRQLYSKSSACVTNSRDIIKVSHHSGLFSEQHLLLSCESTRSSAFIKRERWFKPCWFQVKRLKNMGSRRQRITLLRHIYKKYIYIYINFLNFFEGQLCTFLEPDSLETGQESTLEVLGPMFFNLQVCAPWCWCRAGRQVWNTSLCDSGPCQGMKDSSSFEGGRKSVG